MLGKHKVTIQDAKGRLHTLSRYYAKWDRPRPESSTVVCLILYWNQLYGC